MPREEKGLAITSTVYQSNVPIVTCCSLPMETVRRQQIKQSSTEETNFFNCVKALCRQELDPYEFSFSLSIAVFLIRWTFWEYTLAAMMACTDIIISSSLYLISLRPAETIVVVQ